jgi:hypothetical protein
MIDERDLFVKKREVVDEDNFIFEMAKDDEMKMLELFEKDDDNIRSLREVNREDVFNPKMKEKIQLETNLQLQKRRWMATVPTVLEYYNSAITNLNNKFIL